MLAVMDQCKVTHDVPVQYATLRRRRRSVEDEDVVEIPEDWENGPEGSGEGEEVPDETENELSVPDRVNRFIYCVFESIGALGPDGELNAVPLIKEFSQFEGNEKVRQVSCVTSGSNVRMWLISAERWTLIVSLVLF